VFNLRDTVLLTVQDQKRLLFSPIQPFIDKAICLTTTQLRVLADDEPIIKLFNKKYIEKNITKASFNQHTN